MGLLISVILRKFRGKKQVRILMVGLDGAGKTTILYNLKLGEVVRTIPTIGFNVETMDIGEASFTVWDVGGQDKLRRLWRHYFAHTHGIIFVVDSSDRERMRQAAEELRRLTFEVDLEKAALLIFANKQDVPASMTITEISDKLCLQDITRRKWHIQGVCAIKGTGLLDGLKWLGEAINCT